MRLFLDSSVLTYIAFLEGYLTEALDGLHKMGRVKGVKLSAEESEMGRQVGNFRGEAYAITAKGGRYVRRAWPSLDKSETGTMQASERG